MSFSHTFGPKKKLLCQQNPIANGDKKTNEKNYWNRQFNAYTLPNARSIENHRIERKKERKGSLANCIYIYLKAILIYDW